MPDHTTFTASGFIALFDALKNSIDRRDLLVTCDLLRALVKEGEAPRQIEQAVRAAQADNRLVEFRHPAMPRFAQRVMAAGVRGEIGMDRVHDAFGRLSVDQSGNFRLAHSAVRRFMPRRPELGWCADSAIARLGRIAGDQQLNGHKELRRAFGLALVPDGLANAL